MSAFKTLTLIEMPFNAVILFKATQSSRRFTTDARYLRVAITFISGVSALLLVDGLASLTH